MSWQPAPAAPGLFDANFLPPLRPRARAALSPAIVRSRISSRSNSASAAKIPNTRRPAAVVVSISAPWPASTRRPTPRADRSCTVFQVGQIAAKAVEFRDDEHITLPQGAQAVVESRPVVAYAGGEVVVEVHLVDVGVAQGVALQVPATGSRRSSRRGRSRSACVANGGLGHESAGAFQRAPTSRQRSALFSLPQHEEDLLRHYTLSDEDLQRPECDETSSKAERVGQGG